MSVRSLSSLGDYRRVAGLVAADLRFEWIQSACMILALGAVFSPLFILLGLREGIIGSLLDRLRADPVSRMVMPRAPGPIDPAWLESLHQHAEVVIASPASILQLDVQGFANVVVVSPTAKEDPLLIESGVAPPSGDFWMVASTSFAEQAHKNVGDNVRITLVRHAQREERKPLDLRVVGILPLAASRDVKLWISSAAFDAIYRWRKGQAAPLLGLAASGTGLPPQFDGIVAMLPVQPTDDDYRRMLATGSPFSQLPVAMEEVGWEPAEGTHLLLWSAVNSPVFEADLEALWHRHHELGYSVELAPHLNAFDVKLEAETVAATLTVTVLPPALELGGAKELVGPAPRESRQQAGPPDQLTHVTAPDQPDSGSTDEPVVHVSVDDARLASLRSGQLVFASGSGPIRIPVRIERSPALHTGFLAVPNDLAGQMNVARREPVTYDPHTGTFQVRDNQIRFFRAYAASIDELEELVRFVELEGEASGQRSLREPVSRIVDVRRIRQLASHMETIYLLLALVSGTSGFFAIAANVYAAVQRKRRDLAYLQLLGVGNAALLGFSVFRSLALVAGGVGTALLAYAAFARSAAQIFAGLMSEAASLTRLTVSDVAGLASGILGVAAISSVLAAMSVSAIDAAEHIRN